MKVLSSLLFDYHNDCVDIDGNILYKYLYTRQQAEEYKTEMIPARLEFEKEISYMIHKSSTKSLNLEGYSETAATFVQFNVDLAYSNGQTPNFRERLVCPITKLNNRQRFISYYTQKIAAQKEYKSVFFFEQSTPAYRYISSKLQDANILGSEYLGLSYKPGEVCGGIRHEDVTNLTFNDESFDIVLALDLLPKSPDLNKTICEISRVIRQGGRLIFSLPFSNENTTRQRATYIDKRINNLYEPKYCNNNHTGEQQSLVFYDIGWDLFEMLKSNGFKEVYQLAYYSATYGYLGEGHQFIFIAEK